LGPSEVTVCGLGQLAIAALPAEQVNVTVTAELLQPLELGAGEAEAVILGGPEEVTVKFAPLLVTPETVTTMLPVEAPFGTGTTMVEELQLIADAAVPLKVMALLPWVAPRFVPVILTDEPTEPELGDKPVMLGVGRTVKLTPLLPTPDTVTTMLPVVAPLGTVAAICVLLQFVGVAAIPLNVMVLLPWLAPKFEPVTVTDVPTGPDAGERLAITGAAGGAGEETETLSKVAVARAELVSALTANPTKTF